MKASQTVIKLDGTTKNESLHIVMNGILQEQAEISFKAGIKEVVGFITREGLISRTVLWQDKLKEWGIE